MRRLFRRLSGFYDRHQVAIDLALVTAGASALRRRLEAVHGRLEALEERGLAPLDYLVTVRDVAKIDRRVWVLEGEPGPDPAAAFVPSQGEFPDSANSPAEDTPSQELEAPGPE